MRPLRWGVRDSPGAVPREDGRRDDHDALHPSASRGGMRLDTAETAGSPYPEANGLAQPHRRGSCRLEPDVELNLKCTHTRVSR